MSEPTYFVTLISGMDYEASTPEEGMALVEANRQSYTASYYAPMIDFVREIEAPIRVFQVKANEGPDPQTYARCFVQALLTDTQAVQLKLTIPDFESFLERL